MSALLAGLVLGQLLGIGTTGRESTTLDVSDRTEARIRSQIYGNTIAGVNRGETAFDVENALMATLFSSRHHKSLQLSYGPRFAYLDITGDRALALQHSGRAVGSWWTRRLRLTLSLDGSIGTQSAIAALAPVNFNATRPGQAVPDTTQQNPAVPPPQPAPNPTPTFLPIQPVRALVLYLGSWRATTSATYMFTHRLTGTASVNYGMIGGLDYDSQLTNPPSRGPGADVSLTYNLTRRDALVTTVSSSYTTVLATPLPDVALGPDRHYFVLNVIESWRHQLSRRTTSTLGAGVSYLGSPTVPGQPDTSGVTGNADASIAHTDPIGRHTTLDYRASASLGIVFNPVLGAAQQQVSLVLSSTWTHDKVNAILTGSALATLPWDSPIAARTVSGSFAFGYTPSRAVLLQIGVRAYTQLFPPSYLDPVAHTVTTIRTPPQWVAFLAATFYVPVYAF